MKIALLMGTRPEVIKNYSIARALREAAVECYVLHTNQHRDHELNAAVFAQTGYAPDWVLPGRYRFGKAIDWSCDLIRQLGIDTLLVNGDTAASLIGATAALYSDATLVHVEAGLRSHDPFMIEERNRIMVDAASHFLFTYTEYQAEYLAQERGLRGSVFNVGNTTVDLITDFADKIQRPAPGRYAYVTMHRKEFTDSHERMLSVLQVLNNIGAEFDDLVFPMHPRTRDALHRFGLRLEHYPRIRVLPPVEPFRSLGFIKHAQVVITDSGCIQEEAAIFSTPCVTVRCNTERPETVAIGANIVAGFEPDKISAAIRMQRNKAGRVRFPPIYGSTGVGRRIVDVLTDCPSAIPASFTSPYATRKFRTIYRRPNTERAASALSTNEDDLSPNEHAP
jgi:UDP-N-acetylglucosamine 2-epimerase